MLDQTTKPSIVAALRRFPKILHVLTNKIRGGAEEHALSILTSMREYGFEPGLAAPAELLSAMEPELSAAQVACLPLEFSSLFDLGAGARLSRWIRRERVELLHCHLFAASLTSAGVGKIAGVSAIVETCHGPEAWRIGKRVRGSFWIDRQIGRLVDRYIAVSNAAARHLIENKRIARSKIRVIQNGRDLERYRPLGAEVRAEIRRELGLGADPMLLVMARLDDQKGHRYLIDAVAKLRDRWPRMAVLFAGEGPLRDALRAQADNLGMNGSVRFLGYRGDVPRLLEAADLVVLPSLYEGLPLAAIEALAAGRPLVATAVDGTPEVVIDGTNGILVPPADSAALAIAIDRMLGDRVMASRLGAAGRKHMEENFGLRNQIEKTVAIYRELTGISKEERAA